MGGGAHPLLMSAHTSYPRFRGSCGYYALHLLGGEPSGTTWRALASPALQLERVTARLWSRCAPPAEAFHNIKTLVLRGAGFDDWSAARAWEPVLEHLHRLEALLLVDLSADEVAVLAKAVMPRLRTLVLMNVRGGVYVPASVERLAVLGDCAWMYDRHVELPHLRRLRIVSRRPSAGAHDFVARQECVEEFAFVTRTPDDSAFVLRGTPFEGERILCLRSRRSWMQRLHIR
ncbi:hypothetical protein AURDEDRAFT_113636 [Auricularia subglabra TFB-10046 SS5]|nr:hypothetical protein AURDEDRAFT_113636 [Auricularia subglabra TFB-10046 SS5]